MFVIDKRKPVGHHVDDGRRVSLYFQALLTSIGIPEDSPNFYALRHTFVTVALRPRDKDKEAIRTITGHRFKDRDMLDDYNEEEVADSRRRTRSSRCSTARCWCRRSPVGRRNARFL